MKHIRLGRTGLSVTPWGLGGIPLSTIMGGTTEEAISSIIHAALDRGINFIDTSRMYMDSETNIGEVLKTRRDECILASKSFSRTRDEVLADAEESLAQLQTDRIDIYQVHALRPEEAQAFMAGGGGLEGFREAQKRGLIDYVGLTSHHVDLMVELVGTGEFDTVMFPYNVIERDPENELIPLARARDVGSIVMKPLAGGAIRNRSAAFRFFRSSPVDLILNGVSNTAELDENLACMHNTEPLAAEELRSFEQEVAPLGEQFCRRCSYCMPCPNDIMIPEMIHMCWQMVAGMSPDDLPPEKKAMGQGVLMWLQACTECGTCQEKCPYDLPTIQRKNDLIELFSQ